MPPSNTAAWLTKPKTPLSVSSAPYTPPGPDQIVVRSRAIAVNYCDWAKQDLGSMLFPWVKLPFVMGEDVAGEVVEVGAGADASFKVGDRVLSHAVGLDKISSGASEGAFQEYVVLRAGLVARIPDSVAFERACVLPVCLSTAATGLFCDKHLGLDLPSLDNNAATDGRKAGKGARYIVSACCKGTDKAYVAQMSLNGPPPPKPGALNLVSWLAGAAYAWISTLVKKNLKGVKVEFVWGSDLYDGPVAEAVYGSFLPAALAKGSFVPAPEPQVIGHGLDKVQEAFEVGRKGVSAKKLVVTV
ncbi:hypothetical protein INS49_003937 [Diaporthe citri]|uniref:uncharacterized protein n=1 Tax=Diaporthe citri TaxID=83186 RepID=UPI001C81B715|nr:uncharacterized protein INS49_003937 [Diaporthe citri]KAG6354856.1 hypothetical protein INS49_003937 [Diaporthe citri]